MTYDDWPMAKWMAIYGATVALQVRERFTDGRGAPDLETMKDFIEEAEAVADLAAEAKVDTLRDGK